MFDPKQIPDEVVEAAFDVLFSDKGMRGAIAAGLTAWPVQFSDVDAKGRDVLMLVFPLTQKDANDE